jgi:transposase-like protein
MSHPRWVQSEETGWVHCAKSCTSIQEVAHRHGVRANLLSAWRRQAGKPKAAAKAQFAAVRVRASMPAREGSIEIDFNGGCVRVRGLVDAGMLREVLAAAR